MPVNKLKSYLNNLSPTELLKKAGVQTSPIASSSGSVSQTESGEIKGLTAALAKIANKNYKNSLILRGAGIDNIQLEDWNKNYPYSFVILKALKSKSNDKSSRSTKYEIYKIDGVPLKVHLPINPQSLQISTQFASNLSVASRGILEEHNGINIKTLSFNATTGVFYKRNTFTLERKTDNDLQTLAGGTVQALSDLRGAINAVFSPQKVNNIPKIDSDSLLFTGYYQFHLIRSFLEAYAELKKQPDGLVYRLGFQSNKDNVTYLITPQVFTVNRAATSPMEYTYSFQAIIWGTVDNKELRSANNPLTQFLTNDISKTQKILNSLRQTRLIFEKTKDLIIQFKTDFEASILQPMNNILLSLKEEVGVVNTALDFSNELKKSIAILIVKEIENVLAFFTDSTSNKWKLNKDQLLLNAQALKGEYVQDASADSDVFFKTDGASSLFDPELLDSVPINSLPVTPEIQSSIDQTIENALNTTNYDVEVLIENLNQLSEAIEPTVITQGPDSYLWEILNNIYTTIDNLYSLLSDGFFGGVQQKQNAMLDFYEDYITGSGGEFNRAQGKFSVPLPFGVTLEWLAQRYLGDATRWHEIAAVNNLQPPYIDEDGFIRKFIANGFENKFIVSSDENLYINQTVWLFSDTVSQQKRKIKSIEKISEGQYLITVSGPNDLGQFLVAHNAQMKAYLPYTTNSQRSIYIPIDAPSDLNVDGTKSIGYIQEDPELLFLSKIDFLLDHNGDLAITKSGTQNLSYGKNNLVQAAKLKLETALGSLILHPDYGLEASVGDSEADFSLDDIIQSIRKSFLSDPRFEDISSFEIKRESGVLKIKLNVIVAGLSAIVPLEFNLDAAN